MLQRLSNFGFQRGRLYAENVGCHYAKPGWRQGRNLFLLQTAMYDEDSKMYWTCQPLNECKYEGMFGEEDR
jgi:hypothetical protein